MRTILKMTIFFGSLYSTWMYGQAPYTTTQPDANTPVKFLKVHFHFVRDLNGNNNFNDADAKIAAMNYIKEANKQLTNRPNVLLKYNNSVVSALPAKYRLVLAPLLDDTDYPDADGIYFDNVAGTETLTDTTDAIDLYGNPNGDVISVYFRRGSTGGSAWGLSGTTCTIGIKITDPYNLDCVSTINHEIAHLLGRNHTWGTAFTKKCVNYLTPKTNMDECDDTPTHPNCWSLGLYSYSHQCANNGNALCLPEKISNNLMDYCENQNALTPCQLGGIHQNINSRPNITTTFVYDCKNSSTDCNNTVVSTDISNVHSINISGNSSVQFNNDNNIVLSAGIISLKSGFYAYPTAGKTFTAQSTTITCPITQLNSNENTWDGYHKDYFGGVPSGPTAILRASRVVSTKQSFSCFMGSDTVANINSNKNARKAPLDPTQNTIKEVAKKETSTCYNIYPNPSVGTIHINNICNNAYTIQIFNSSGILVYNEKENKEQVSIPLVGVGLFYIQIYSNNELYTQKIISYEKE